MEDDIFVGEIVVFERGHEPFLVRGGGIPFKYHLEGRRGEGGRVSVWRCDPAQIPSRGEGGEGGEQGR